MKKCLPRLSLERIFPRLLSKQLSKYFLNLFNYLAYKLKFEIKHVYLYVIKTIINVMTVPQNYKKPSKLGRKYIQYTYSFSSQSSTKSLPSGASSSRRLALIGNGIRLCSGWGVCGVCCICFEIEIFGFGKSDGFCLDGVFIGLGGGIGFIFINGVAEGSKFTDDDDSVVVAEAVVVVRLRFFV